MLPLNDPINERYLDATSDNIIQRRSDDLVERYLRSNIRSFIQGCQPHLVPYR
jgi:hypothetical protein